MISSSSPWNSSPKCPRNTICRVILVEDPYPAISAGPESSVVAEKPHALTVYLGIYVAGWKSPLELRPENPVMQNQRSLTAFGS